MRVSAVFLASVLLYGTAVAGPAADRGGPTPERIAGAGDLARAADQGRGPLVAVSELTEWHDAQQGLRSAATRELVATARTSPREDVRAAVVQFFALRDGDFDPDVVTMFASALRYDDAAGIRAIAALGLGGVRDESRPLAIRELVAAYGAETDLEVRRNIITHLVRAAITEAIPILRRLDTDHPLLVLDVNDYVEILHSGLTSPDEIYAAKSHRDIERGTMIGAEAHHD